MARKFGVEIEFVYDRASRHAGADRLMAELQVRGINVIDNRRSHLGHDRTSWTLKYDGSVTYGDELVSPPLDFDDPEQLGQVATVCEALQAAGCNSDDRAGVHVHVECQDFTPKQLAAVLRFCYKFEDALYRIASSGWERMRSTRWCRPIPETLASEAMRIRAADDVRRIWYDQVQRYMIVNVHPWYRQGTLEFRLFNSTLNPKRLRAYIALAVSIVEDARRGYNRSTKKHFATGYMAAQRARNGDDRAEKAMILKLQQILRYQSGMSEEDWKLVRFCWNDSANQGASIHRSAA